MTHDTFLSDRVASFGKTVFAEITALAIKHKAVNLGQGFPNFPCPDFIKEAAIKAIENNQNQYAPSGGSPKLLQTISQVYSPFFNRELLNEEITVTVGATEAIFAACQAFINPGDEVIIIEPFYDSYPAAVSMAGGKAVYVPLHHREGTWQLDVQELTKAFNPKTRLIMLNTPHNPTGKVFSRKELESIAELCQKNNVIALSDEVYEHMVFDGLEHIRLATLRDMWQRTVTISSAGKIFSVTGWKVGWAIGHPLLIQGIAKARQWISFSVATPFQEAVANALQTAVKQGYFQQLAQMYQQKRDILVQVLEETGFSVLKPQGTYFAISDFGKQQQFKDDFEFCRYLISKVGVAAIPPSAFYSKGHKHLGQKLTRFCFCKDNDLLQEAAKRIQESGARIKK